MAKIRAVFFRYLQLFWKRKLKIIVLAMLALIFTLGFHGLPGQTRVDRQFPPSLTSDQDQSTLQEQAPKNTQQLVQQGRTLYQAGQFSLAAQSLKQAAQVYESQDDVLNQALALSYLSLAQQKLGQWNQATEAIATSRNLLTNSKLKTRDSKLILALVLNTQGSLQLALGQAPDAIESWKQAASAYAQLGDQAGNVGSLINLATGLQSLGLYRQAVKTFEQVEQTLQAQPNSLLKAAGLRSLGNTLRVVGDLDKSGQVLEQSLATAQHLQSRQEESATLLSLGNTAVAFGNIEQSRQDTTNKQNPVPGRCTDRPLQEKAKKYYNLAADSYQQAEKLAPSAIARLQAQLNRLSVLLTLQQMPTAEELDSIQFQNATLTPSRAAVYAKVNFAQSLTCIKQRTSQDDPSWSEITQLLNRAVQQAQNLKDERTESYALGNLGQLYEQTKQWSIARQYTELALNLAQSINASDVAYQWQWQLGRLLLAQGDSDGAIAAYSQAVESLKSLRSDLVALNPDVQFDFRDEVEPVYRQLVTLLLQPEKPSQKNLKQARDVIEALQLAELDNFFRDACLNAKPQQIDEVVDSANSTAAVIYPIILADRLEVILKLPHLDELRHYRIYQAKSQVESTLDELQQKLQERFTFRDREALSQKVYNWLIKAAEPDLEDSQVKTLVFVLDGSLRSIPMTALYDGKQYLVEKYSVALAPGLQLLTPNPKGERLQVLTAGLTESRLGFSALPNVANELKAIKSVIRSRELLNQTFTTTSIENQISSVSFPVIHLATHGKFSSQLAETFILAWDSKMNVNQLREVLQTREPVLGRASRLLPPIELLVLSACETATGDQRAALGLAGVAVRSGARSTLASLWQVDDKSTAILMGEFYRQLVNNPNLTKAEALRRAQQLILQKYKEHPFYWAPYVLVGNWL